MFSFDLTFLFPFTSTFLPHLTFIHFYLTFQGRLCDQTITFHLTLFLMCYLIALFPFETYMLI